MVNPFEPPTESKRYASFPIRFLRGLRLAVNEYRRGLRREKFTLLTHLWAWCSFLFFTAMLLLILGGLISSFW